MKRAAAAALFLFRFRPCGLPCWRLALRKPLRFRQATPTGAPLSGRAGFPVGALLPASPCAFVRPRQQRRRFPGARPSLLAPCIPQALVPSSGHANPGAFFPARDLPCWRLAPPKPLLLRWTAPTMRLEKRRAAFPVGALHPASPCSTVGLRQPRRLFSSARPSMLAPCSRQALAPSSGHANPGAFFPARGLPCWRLVPCKPLRLRRATPTPVPRSGLVRARRPAKPMNSVFEREPPAWAREGFGSDCVKQKTQEFPSTSLNEC